MLQIIRPIWKNVWSSSSQLRNGSNSFFQSDQAEVPIVYKAFYELPGVFEQLPTSDKQNIYLKKLSKERFDFMYGNTHGVGYILDPRFIGDGMSQQVLNKIEDFILAF